MTLFSDLKLDPKVLKAVQEAGYTAPTPIQAGAIPPALEGRDVLGIAQTGTGKTAGFTLPMITLLGRGRARARMPRSLVLCPTRELAAQVAENFDTYAKHTRLTKALLIGGVSFGEQDKLIDRGVDVLIATPGRLLDHFERGKLLLTGVQIMVVDEADRMLDMGFIPDIERIFQLTPFTRQTLFFSATMAPEIERITNTFLHNPERIEVARQATTSETIEQRLVELTPTRKDQTAKQKRELLRALIDAEGAALKNAIIFSNRKTDVDIVSKSLRAHGYDAAAIHGDLDQTHRTRTLDDFREGRLRFLVASDVAARGLDIPAVSHVFNFDLPSHAEDYVHRIGRTGRAGRTGTAVSIAVPMDEKYLSAIESLVKAELPRAPLPEGFVPTEGSASARPARGEGEGRAGSRSRSRGGRGGRSREEQRPAVTGAALAEARPAPQPELAEPAREVERSPAPAPAPAREPREERRDERGSERSSDRGERHDRGPRDNGAREQGERHERSNERGGERSNERGGHHHRHGDRDRNRGEAIMGMGDHVPEFLTRSFLDALAATERGDVERAQAAALAQEQAERKAREAAERAAKAAETAKAAKAEARQAAEAAEIVAEVSGDAPAAEVAEVAAQPARPATRSRSRSRAKPAAETEVVAAEAEAVAQPVTEGGAEAASAPVDSEAPAQPEAPKRRSSPRRKAPAAETAEAPTTESDATSGDSPATPEAAEAEVKTPVRRTPTRRKAAPAGEAATEGAAAKAPAKAATKAPAKAAAKAPAEAEAAAPADAESEAPAKPRRTVTRRKPAAKATTVEPGAEPSPEAAPDARPEDASSAG